MGPFTCYESASLTNVFVGSPSLGIDSGTNRGSVSRFTMKVDSKEEIAGFIAVTMTTKESVLNAESSAGSREAKGTSEHPFCFNLFTYVHG